MKRSQQSRWLQAGWGLGICLMAAGWLACKQEKAPDQNKAAAGAKGRTAASRPTSQPARRAAEAAAPWILARPQPAWVTKRVEEAKARMQASEGGKLMWQAIEAAGGLTRWYSNGPLAFRFIYAPVKKKGVRDTRQVIDTWSARARHTYTKTPSQHFGWDGKQAWRLPKDQKQALNARFWSLTPFYFVGVPFVFADPGVLLKKLKPAKLEGRQYDLVHASFAAGTGDAPKDYYIVYIDAKTKRVGGVRYVVSYPGFFPKGGHSPEKLMTYDGKQTVTDIHFPKTFRTFKWDTKKQRRGKLVTRATMSEVDFRTSLASSFFATPQDAEPLTGWK